MGKLKYKVLPEGSFDGMLKINLLYLDAKDVAEAGLTNREACCAVAKDFDGAAAIDVIDRDAITVTSDGIIADSAVVAFGSIDNHMIHDVYGFIPVSERPYTRELVLEEPHMKQWDKNYPGKRLYRGPSPVDRGEDKGRRDPHNENMSITGRISNNNTGSEILNLIDMTEVLTPFYGMMQIMDDGEVLVGMSGPEISVGIGMIVRERGGRIFGWSYGAGMTAHRSGEYAKTVKSDIPAILGPKSMITKYVLRALNAGCVVGRDISCSPVNLMVAYMTGHEIDLDNISNDSWIELESVGISREMLSKPVEKPLSDDEAIARADEFVPGCTDGKLYKVSDYSEYRYAEV